VGSATSALPTAVPEEETSVKGTILYPIRYGWLIGCALLTVAVCGPARAQANITGKVTVPQGASLTGIRVVACDPTTNRIFQGTVDASGNFTIANVAVGTFTVTVFGPGFAPQTFQNVKVASQPVTQNVTFTAAKPVCIVKAAAPIPLTDDINSASFADAPELLLNSGCNIVEGLANIANFTGSATLGGRFKMKYSDQAFHLAADILFPQPNVNFGSDTELFKGNSLEILFQNDPFNATRTQLDPMHNFRVVIAVTNPPRLRLGNQLEQTPKLNNADVKIADLVLVKERPDGKGNLVRANIPWGLFVTTGSNPTPMPTPKDNDIAAMDIRINNTVPGATATTAGRQFQLALSGLPGTVPTALIPVQFCPKP